MMNVHARPFLHMHFIVHCLLPGFADASFKTCSTKMRTNQTLLPKKDQRGTTWHFDELFSTNMLDKTLSESNVIEKLQEMLSSRLGHRRPKSRHRLYDRGLPRVAATATT